MRSQTLPYHPEYVHQILCMNGEKTPRHHFQGGCGEKLPVFFDGVNLDGHEESQVDNVLAFLVRCLETNQSECKETDQIPREEGH